MFITNDQSNEGDEETYSPEPRTPKLLGRNSPTYPTTPNFNISDYLRSPSFQGILSPTSDSPNFQRDVLIKRINELTIEKSELSAKLFKQEKQYDELSTQNAQLLKKTEIMDEVVKSNFNLQQDFNSLQEKNLQLLQTIEQLKAENNELRISREGSELTGREKVEGVMKIIEEYENIQELFEKQIQQSGELLKTKEDEKILIANELNQKISQLQYELQIRETNERNYLEKIRMIEEQNNLMIEENQTLIAELQLKQQIITDSAHKELAEEVISLNSYVEHLKQENYQLHQQINQYYNQLIHSQSNIEKLTQRYENEIDQLHKLFDQTKEYLKGDFEELPDTPTNETSLEIPDHLFKDLRDLRDEYKKVTWDEDAEMEEIQNHKIHQLLDEINLLEILLSNTSKYYCEFIQKYKSVIADSNSTIISSQSRIANLLDENEKLLYAVETGDLQPYLLLQEKKNQELLLQLEAHKTEQEKLEKQNQILMNEPCSIPNENNEKIDTAIVNKKNSGWFSWFKFV